MRSHRNSEGSMAGLSPGDRAILMVADRHFPDRSGRILEIGSGAGRVTRHLLAAGYRNIVATDLDPWAADQAPAGARFVLQDSSEDPLPAKDGSCSAVLMIHVIEHIVNPDRLLGEVHRCLAADGKVLVVTPDFVRSVKTFYGDRTHVHPYIPKSLGDALTGNGFVVERMTHTNVMRPLGRLRPLWERFPQMVFTGSALLAVGRKI